MEREKRRIQAERGTRGKAECETYIHVRVYMYKEKKERNAAKETRCGILRTAGRGLGRGGGERKWAGLVRLIAPELCRKNKLSCSRRAELGWAGKGDCRRVVGARWGEDGLRVDRHQDWKIPRFQIRRLGT